MRGYNAMGIANNARLQQLVLRHAQFPAIVDLAHDIQRQGALPAKQEEMSARHRQVCCRHHLSLMPNTQVDQEVYHEVYVDSILWFQVTGGIKLHVLLCANGVCRK